MVFEDFDDVEEWLAPYDFEAFWDAIGPWNIFDPDDRARYEGLIASGEVDGEVLLTCIKDMACWSLRRRFGLKDRIYEPPDAQYLRRTH